MTTPMMMMMMPPGGGGGAGGAGAGGMGQSGTIVGSGGLGFIPMPPAISVNSSPVMKSSSSSVAAAAAPPPGTRHYLAHNVPPPAPLVPPSSTSSGYHAENIIFRSMEPASFPPSTSAPSSVSSTTSSSPSSEFFSGQFLSRPPMERERASTYTGGDTSYTPKKHHGQPSGGKLKRRSRSFTDLSEISKQQLQYQAAMYPIGFAFPGFPHMSAIPLPPHNGGGPGQLPIQPAVPFPWAMPIMASPQGLHGKVPIRFGFSLATAVVR